MTGITLFLSIYVLSLPANKRVGRLKSSSDVPLRYDSLAQGPVLSFVCELEGQNKAYSQNMSSSCSYASSIRVIFFLVHCHNLVSLKVKITASNLISFLQY